MLNGLHTLGTAAEVMSTGAATSTKWLVWNISISVGNAWCVVKLDRKRTRYMESGATMLKVYK